MYVGRFVVIGSGIGAYRVSSRSFPDRMIVEGERRLTVVPTEDAAETDNPYVSYNCARWGPGYGVVGNGSHVDPITEKLELGYPPRDALILGLFALDYEKDAYDTPRLAGVVGSGAYVGIVRRDALVVREVSEPTLVATYEVDEPEPVAFDAKSAGEAVRSVFGMEYEHAVCAAVLRRVGDGWERAVENG